VEDAAPWKSPSAGLSHLAWKSLVGRRDFHFSHRPCRDDQYVDFPLRRNSRSPACSLSLLFTKTKDFSNRGDRPFNFSLRPF
jgi:hypothetical protein